MASELEEIFSSYPVDEPAVPEGNPPDKVLVELGRLVWAAINLEDVVWTFCRAVEPYDLFDRSPVGTRINHALTALKKRPDGGLRQRAAAWLSEAKAALEDRNEIVHSTPGELIAMLGAPEPGTWLIHFPNDPTKPAVHRAFTVDSLRAIRLRLEEARGGWSDLSPELWETRPRGE